MSNLFVEEVGINLTERYRCYESGIYESGTSDTGELYRAYVREYGRCTGKVMIGDGTPIGWVFIKRRQYEDTGEWYLAETWVTLHKAQPTVTTEYHYHELG